MNIISQPLLNLLIVFYHLLFNNLGWAIVGFTAFLRLILIPLTMPSMKMMQSMREVAPELEKIKKKYKGDNKKLMQAQADFYRERGINPYGGCVPQLVTLVVFIALSSAFFGVFKGDVTANLNKILYTPFKVTGHVDTSFFGKDLTKPDILHIPGVPFGLPGLFVIVLSSVYLLSSKMMMPNVEASQKIAKKTQGEADDIATSMQSQMMYMMPLVMLVSGLRFPVGVILYLGISSLLQSIQQYFVSGWGGLTPWIKKVKRW